METIISRMVGEQEEKAFFERKSYRSNLGNMDFVTDTIIFEEKLEVTEIKTEIPKGEFKNLKGNIDYQLNVLQKCIVYLCYFLTTIYIDLKATSVDMTNKRNYLDLKRPENNVDMVGCLIGKMEDFCIQTPKVLPAIKDPRKLYNYHRDNHQKELRKANKELLGKIDDDQVNPYKNL
jgi:hypothetical protein